MRLRGLRRRPAEVRRAVLPRGHPVHHFRPRGCVPVPLGHFPRRDRRVRFLVDGGVPRHPDRRLHLRMEEGSAGMGVTSTRGATTPAMAGPASPVALRSESDAPIQAVADETTDKGFVVTQIDKLVNWARTGSLWPMTFG